jgi:hypothetical protein
VNLNKLRQVLAVALAAQFQTCVQSSPGCDGLEVCTCLYAKTPTCADDYTIWTQRTYPLHAAIRRTWQITGSQSYHWPDSPIVYVSSIMLASTQLGRSAMFNIAQHNFTGWTGKNCDLSDGGIRATIVIDCVIPGVCFLRLHIAIIHVCVCVCR